MSTAWVEEYDGIGEAIQAPQGPPTRVQAVTFTGTSGVTALALAPGTRVVVLSTNADGHFRIGYASNTAATTGDAPIFAKTHRPVTLRGKRDKYLSFIAAA